MKRLLLVVLCGAIFLEGIDIGMLNVALPSIRADLGLETAELSWVVGGYVLGYAGFMLLGGRAADLLGRRRMFLLWLAVFIAFSGLGGFATESWMLILARFVTGVASAFMTPAGLSIITTAFPEGPRRDRALMIYAATGAGGFSLGLVAGGVLASANWRLVFFAPVVLAALILLGAIPLTPRDRRPEAGGRFDVLGAVTITAAMVLLALGVTRLEHGLGPVPLAAFAGGALSLAAFVAVERRAAHPLVRLAILRNPGLLRADLTAMLLAGSFMGFQFLASLYLQEHRSWTPMQTSLALLVMGLDAVLAPTLTPVLVRRYGTARVALGGMLAAAAAYALFLPVGPDWTYAAMFPSFLLVGLAFTLAYGPLTIAATDGVPAAEQGLAGGLLYTSVQFGAALGLSAVTAVAADLNTALIVPLVAALLGSLVMATGARVRERVPAT